MGQRSGWVTESTISPGRDRVELIVLAEQPNGTVLVPEYYHWSHNIEPRGETFDHWAPAAEFPLAPGSAPISTVPSVIQVQHFGTPGTLRAVATEQVPGGPNFIYDYQGSFAPPGVVTPWHWTRLQRVTRPPSGPVPNPAVDMLPRGTPALIQSVFGSHGNFELITPDQGGGLAHFWLNNDRPGSGWIPGARFAQDSGLFDAVAMLQDSRTNELQLVATQGERIALFTRSVDPPRWTWHGPTWIVDSGATGVPSLLEYYSPVFSPAGPPHADYILATGRTDGSVQLLRLPHGNTAQDWTPMESMSNLQADLTAVLGSSPDQRVVMAVALLQPGQTGLRRISVGQQVPLQLYVWVGTITATYTLSGGTWSSMSSIGTSVSPVSGR